MSRKRGAKAIVTAVAVIVLGSGVAAAFAVAAGDGREQNRTRSRVGAHTPAASPTPTPPTATPSPPSKAMATPRSTPPGEPSQTPPSEAQAWKDAFAIWPGDTPVQAAEQCSAADAAWRGNTSRVALRFAAVKLGWRHAKVTRTEGAAGSTYVTVSDGDRHSVVVAETGGYPGGPGGYPGNRCYSVTQVQPGGAGGAWTVSIHGTQAQLSFRTMGADSIVVTVGHGTHSTSKVVHAGSVSFDLGYEPQAPGYALVVYRDSSGDVFSARGTSLPAGDSAAG